MDGLLECWVVRGVLRGEQGVGSWTECVASGLSDLVGYFKQKACLIAVLPLGGSARGQGGCG